MLITPISIILSSILVGVGLRLLMMSPLGADGFSAASLALTLVGIIGLAAVYSRASGVSGRPLNASLKVFLGVLGLALMVSGVVLALYSFGGNFSWPELGRETACFALLVPAGALCMVLLSDPRRDSARQEFHFITGEKFRPGWRLTGLQHFYEGERRGIPLRASVAVASADKRGLTRYVVKVSCLIDNPRKIELLACVDGARIRTFFSRLPKIPRVPYWNGYIVRGAPAGLIPEMISPFRKTPVTIFSEAYGFEHVHVSGNAVRARFVLHGAGEEYRLGDIVDGLAFFSGHFN